MIALHQRRDNVAQCAYASARETTLEAYHGARGQPADPL